MNTHTTTPAPTKQPRRKNARGLLLAGPDPVTVYRALLPLLDSPHAMFTGGEVEVLTHVDVKTRRKMQSRGEFPFPVQLSERKHMYRAPDIAAWLNSHKPRAPLPTPTRKPDPTPVPPPASVKRANARRTVATQLAKQSAKPARVKRARQRAEEVA